MCAHNRLLSFFLLGNWQPATYITQHVIFISCVTDLFPGQHLQIHSAPCLHVTGFPWRSTVLFPEGSWKGRITPAREGRVIEVLSVPGGRLPQHCPHVRPGVFPRGLVWFLASSKHATLIICRPSSFLHSCSCSGSVRASHFPLGNLS